MNEWISPLLDSLEEANQNHIVERGRNLTPEAAQQFLAPLRGLNISMLCDAAVSGHGKSEESADRKIEPPKSVDRITDGPLNGQESEALDIGEELLASGKVAILVVAGGMGTRLGWPGPKGTFPVGPVTDRTLFQIFAQQIQALNARYGQPIPWAVQTSPANHGATCAYFEKEDFLGLPKDSVQLFPQGVLPAFDEDGKIALLEDGHIVALPDGHGGVYQALRKEGVLSRFDELGIETVFYFQVDNPLGPLGDPRFLGHHKRIESEMSTLIIPKREPNERVGVLANVDGRLQVIEYTEIDASLSEQRNEDGRLRLRAANTGIHAFETSFLHKVSQDRALPLHLASKPIPAGSIENPEGKKTPGTKMEYFVFDALPLAENSLVYEAPRSHAFAPVKSAEGQDTPEQAREALSAYYHRLLSDAGLSLPMERPIEIDARLYDNPKMLTELFHAASEQTGPLVLRPEDGTEG